MGFSDDYRTRQLGVVVGQCWQQCSDGATLRWAQATPTRSMSLCRGQTWTTQQVRFSGDELFGPGAQIESGE